MSEYKTVPTTYEVWAALLTSHPELVIFGAYSHPSGDPNGDSSIGKMFTSYGFKQGHFPIIEALTTWTINPEKTYERLNEKHEFWLCLPEKQEE